MNWSGQYDLVLLDVTASGALSNVIALAHHSDGVLWCARWGHSLKCGVKRVTHEMRRHGTNVLGLAITMVDFRQLRRYERPRIACLEYQEVD
jgi:Mrp family chromosome partitioning ATPase